MKKIGNFILYVIKGFVLSAVAFQILFGIVYIVGHLGSVPKYYETTLYLKMAETLVIDEYTGMLYPLLIRLCSLISLIPFQIPLYLIQIGIGFFSVYYFVYTWSERQGISVFCALWLNTIPFIAQAHVTVLPDSIAYSLLVIMLAEILRCMRRRISLSMTGIAIVMGCYLILGQISREYFFAGSLLAVWAVLVQLYSKWKKAVVFLITMLICIGMIVGHFVLYHVTQSVGSYGRIQRSISASLFQRVGMSTMADKFMIYMPEEVKETFSGNELEEFARYPYKVQNEFGPRLEAEYGKKEANKIYRKMAFLGFGNATMDSIESMTEDMFAYMLPGSMYLTWRDGKTREITSWNYQQFIELEPKMSVLYAKVSQAFWLIGFSVCVAVCMIQALRAKKLYLRSWFPITVYIALYAGYFTVFGAIGYDYKLALLPLVVSYMPIIYIMMWVSKDA